MDSFKYNDYKEWLEKNDVLYEATEVDSKRFKHDQNLLTLQIEITDHAEISGFWEFTALHSYNEGIDNSSISDFIRILPPKLEEIKNATKTLKRMKAVAGKEMEQLFQLAIDKKYGANGAAPLRSFDYDVSQQCFFLTDTESYTIRIDESEISEYYTTIKSKEKKV